MGIQDFRADAMRCTRCAYCKWIPFDLVKSWRFAKGCPSIEYGKFHSYSAGGRLVTALSLMDGRSTVTEPVKKSVFMCLMCGSCDVACKICRYDMEPLQAMRELRAELIKDGHLPPHVEPILESLKNELNMMGEPKEKRGDWAQELEVKDLTKTTAKVVFHAGCRYAFDGALGGIARSAVKILKNAGIDFGILGAAESCCGGRAFTMGFNDQLAYASDRLLTCGRPRASKPSSPRAPIATTPSSDFIPSTQARRCGSCT